MSFVNPKTQTFLPSASATARIAHGATAAHAPRSLALSIATAEGASAGVSIGAAYLVGQHEKWIEPARDLLAKHVFYPCAGGKLQDGKRDPAALEKAQDKASVALKSMIMTGTGFATFVGTQMKMEGRCDVQELKHVVQGKSLGLLATIVSMGVLGKFAPGVMKKVEDAASTIAAPLCGNVHKKGEAAGPDKDDHKPGSKCEETQELCKLMILEVSSSFISGIVNYAFTRGRMAH